MSATLHKSDSNQQTSKQRVAEQRQRKKREQEVLRTQIDSSFVNLRDDNALLGDDDSRGAGKAAMAAAIIESYGAQAFTAFNGDAEVRNYLRGLGCGGGPLVQVVDSAQDLMTRPQLRVIGRTALPAFKRKDSLIEFSRDLLWLVLDRRRIDLGDDADGPTWMIHNLDVTANVTYLRRMVWKKRHKLHDHKRDTAALGSLNVTALLQDVAFQGQYESVCSNKALLAIVAAQMAFELQNDNLDEGWERPFRGSASHVEVIALLGGTSDCVAVVSTGETNTVSLGPNHTTTVEEIEHALQHTPKQGQGESMLFHVVWQLQTLAAARGLGLHERLFTFV